MSTATSPMAGLQRFTRAKEERFTFKRRETCFTEANEGSRETCFTERAANQCTFRIWSHHSGKSYTVDTSQCDCPDFINRQGPAGKVCKHVLALREYLKEDHG